MNKLHLKIGTSSSNELVLEDLGIDSQHLELFCDEYGNVFITDLESANGTFVNDQKLNGFKLLVAGDKVRLGKTYIFYWENFILNANFDKKKEADFAKVISIDKPSPSPSPSPSPPPSSKVSFLNWIMASRINLQLFIIYGIIVFLLIFMYIVL